MTGEQLSIIARAHEWVDQPDFQTAEYTFMHAMRQPDQTVDEACEQTNRYLSLVASDAISAKLAGRQKEALFLFAVALHTMQDSTSPSHRGFQVWSGHETGGEVAEHIRREMMYPGRGSELDVITRQAWTAYQSGNLSGFKVNCACR